MSRDLTHADYYFAIPDSLAKLGFRVMLEACLRHDGCVRMQTHRFGGRG